MFKLLQPVRNVAASETNPVRDGWYLRTIERRGGMNAGRWAQVLHADGSQTQTRPENLEPLSDVSLVAQLAQAEQERDGWKDAEMQVRGMRDKAEEERDKWKNDYCKQQERAEKAEQERDEYRESALQEMETCQRANADNAKLLTEKHRLRTLVEELEDCKAQLLAEGRLLKDALRQACNACEDLSLQDPHYYERLCDIPLTAAEVERVRKLETVAEAARYEMPYYVHKKLDGYFCVYEPWFVKLESALDALDAKEVPDADS